MKELYLPRLAVLASAFFLMAGCSDREGELVTHFITCRTSEGGTWVSADNPAVGPMVIESKYQVSFASQRVVSATGRELQKCTVYDRRNWNCHDAGNLSITGPGSFAAKDGHLLTNCSKVTGYCYLDVGLVSRAMIALRGHDEVSRLCGVNSRAFKLIQESGK